MLVWVVNTILKWICKNFEKNTSKWCEACVSVNGHYGHLRSIHPFHKDTRVLLHQSYVSVSGHPSGFCLFHKDTSNCCSTLHGHRMLIFCQCEQPSKWILPFSQGHQQLLFDHSWPPDEVGPSFQFLRWWRPSACCDQSTPQPLCTNQRRWSIKNGKRHRLWSLRTCVTAATWQTQQIRH